jgi:DNA-3-methyladenine glycosylase
MLLKSDFYRRNDILAVSRELLGKVLVTRLDGAITAAVITETEAYAGVGDRASHAFGGRRTARTEPMFAAGGIAYVYLCYGIHHLFNVVAGDAGNPLAVLIRAGEAIEGTATIRDRRRKSARQSALLTGPGNFARGLGITTALTGHRLDGHSLWIEDRDFVVAREDVLAGPRVGVDYAGEDAKLPYRFRTLQFADR